MVKWGLKNGEIRKEVSLWRGFDGGPSIVVDFLRAAVWRPGSVMRLFEVGGPGGLAARAWGAEIIKVGGNLIGRNDFGAAPKKGQLEQWQTCSS